MTSRRTMPSVCCAISSPAKWWSSRSTSMCSSRAKILQIEYMSNLWEIGADTCQLIALPLNTQHADGSQIRVIAVVEE